jgi:hypothetical protein
MAACDTVQLHLLIVGCDGLLEQQKLGKARVLYNIAFSSSILNHQQRYLMISLVTTK